MRLDPEQRFRTLRPLGQGQENHPDDVESLRRTLDELGHYHLPNGMPGRFDEQVASRLRGLQMRHGLEADGIIRPGGPTQQMLNHLLAGGVTRLVPNPASTPDRISFRQRLALKGPVGGRRPAHPDDEAVVRHGLALQGDLPLGAVVRGNPLSTDTLRAGIARFHQRRGLSGGEVMAPGSRGEAILRKELDIAHGDKLPEEASRSITDLGLKGNGSGGQPLLRNASDREQGASEDSRPNKNQTEIAQGDSPGWLQDQVEILGTELPPDRKTRVNDTVTAMNAIGYDARTHGFDGDLPPIEDRLDVLRAYYEEQRLGVRPELSPDVVKAIHRIYASLDIDPHFLEAQRSMQESTFEALATDLDLRQKLASWGTLDAPQRQEVLTQVSKKFAAGFKLSRAPEIRLGALPGLNTYAAFQTDNSVEGFGFIQIDPERLAGGKDLTILNDLIHELAHAYQQDILMRLFANEISKSDPRRLQSEIFGLSRAFYGTLIAPFRNDNDVYFDDPNERHAQKLKYDWNLFAQTHSD